jgi:hypothetical protein
MPNYSNGKIYKLVCDDPDLIYYGSTTIKLSQRMAHHRCDKNACVSKKLFDVGNVKIILVENYPCNSKEELNKKERDYIDNNNCINKCKPIRYENETKQYIKEYVKNNKVKITDYQKKYYEDNKETIKNTSREREQRQDVKEYRKQYYKEKITCECGAIVRKGDISTHKKTIKHQKFINNNQIQPAEDC